MSELTITLNDDRKNFQPGDAIEGRVAWRADGGRTPSALEVRLFWYTQGKGTRDVSVVDRKRVESPPSSGEDDFAFTAPAQPYGFAGTLISLQWALELVVEPGKEAERVDIVIGPNGKEVTLAG